MPGPVPDRAARADPSAAALSASAAKCRPPSRSAPARRPARRRWSCRTPFPIADRGAEQRFDGADELTGTDRAQAGMPGHRAVPGPGVRGRPPAGRRAARTGTPYGAQRPAGTTGANSETTGVPTAAARCAGPVLGADHARGPVEDGGQHRQIEPTAEVERRDPAATKPVRVDSAGRTGDDHPVPRGDQRGHQRPRMCSAAGRRAAASAPGWNTTYGLVTGQQARRRAAAGGPPAGRRRRRESNPAATASASSRSASGRSSGSRVPQVQQRARVVLADGADPADPGEPEQQGQRQRGLVERGADQGGVEALATEQLQHQGHRGRRSSGGGIEHDPGRVELEHESTPGSSRATSPPAAADEHRDVRGAARRRPDGRRRPAGRRPHCPIGRPGRARAGRPHGAVHAGPRGCRRTASPRVGGDGGQDRGALDLLQPGRRRWGPGRPAHPRPGPHPTSAPMSPITHALGWVRRRARAAAAIDHPRRRLAAAAAVVGAVRADLPGVEGAEQLVDPCVHPGQLRRG